MSHASVRNTPTYVTAALALLGVLLIVVAIVYYAEPARSLPFFFPGRQVGSNHHHTTHGLAASILGVVALVGCWMSGGVKRGV